MSNLEGANRDVDGTREPRPFLYLKAKSLPIKADEVDAASIAELHTCVEPQISQIVRGLVDFTMARDNQRTRRTQPIPMSVLNRRRRAARSWVLAVAEGRFDAVTLHSVSTQWLPLLCGTGPNLAKLAEPAVDLIEFVRGAATACIFDEVTPNLLPHARALHALETTLSAHLAAAQQTALRAELSPTTGG